MNVESTVNKKNKLVQELNAVLNELKEVKVDMLCDEELSKAVNNHIALELAFNKL